MLFAVDESTRREAKTPHELAMVNLIVFNLMAGAGLLAGSMAQPDSSVAGVKWIVVVVPLLVSIAVMGWTWLRAHQAPSNAPWFVQTHWRLASSRYRLILAAYLVSSLVLSIGLFAKPDVERIGEQIRDLPPAMQEMERRKLASQDMAGAVWARIAVVPFVLAVMVTIMLESGALYQAGRGEIPDAMLARFPPPDGLPVITEFAETNGDDSLSEKP